MFKVLIALSFVLTGLSAFADSIVGVGIVISQPDHVNTRIEQVIATGPAARAGAQAGEFIVAVDSQTIAGVALQDIVNRIRGDIGTHVVLTVGDLRGHNRDLDLVREEIAVPACFMEGAVNLTLNVIDPASPFSIMGYVGDEPVNWNVSGGWINAPYRGEMLQLNFMTNGTSTQIRGFVHGAPVMWYGMGNTINAYQACIP